MKKGDRVIINQLHGDLPCELLYREATIRHVYPSPKVTVLFDEPFLFHGRNYVTAWFPVSHIELVVKPDNTPLPLPG